MAKQLRQDRYIISILVGHMVFSSKYSVNFIAKKLKGRSSRILQQEFPEIKIRNQKVEMLCAGLGLKSGMIRRWIN